MAARASAFSPDPRTNSKAKATSVSASKRPAEGGPEDERAAKHQAPTGVQPVEPEDAYLTGVSRSLQRRLLGLNVEGSQGQSRPHPEATAEGLHSTGSFTKKSSAPEKSSERKKK
jgi:hypothetical protein